MKKIFLPLCLSIILLIPVVFAQENTEIYNGTNKTSQKSIESNANNAKMYCENGYLMETLKEYSKAIEDFDKALELNPNYAEAYYGKAIAESNLGKNKDAIYDYSQAIELNSKYAEAYYGRGNSENILLKPEEAIKDFDKAIELNSKYDEAYCNRGELKVTLGKSKDALKDFDKALSINAKNIKANLLKNITQQKLKMYEKKIEICNKTVELNPNDFKAYYLRGCTKRALENNEEAIEDFSKAIALNPEYAEAYYLRGMTECDIGRTNEGKADFDKALKLNIDFKNAYLNMFPAKYLPENLKNKRIEITSEAYQKNGLRYIEQGENNEAIKNFNIALELNPNNTQAYKDLKYLLSNSEKNVKINPESFPSRKNMSTEEKFNNICNAQVTRPMEYENDDDWDSEADRYKLENPVLFPIVRWSKQEGTIDRLKMGYMDKTGKIIIKPQYWYADDFYEGLARVYLGGNRCAGHFCKDMYDTQYLYGGKYGYIGIKGEFEIKPKFVYASRFSEGFAAVKIKDKYGYINKLGKIVIKPKFYCAGEFEAGQASVCMNNKTYKRILINKKGKLAQKDPKYDRVHKFSEGMAIVEKDGKMGAINSEKNLVIYIDYDYLSSFREGLAVAKTGGWYGFIDKTGEFVIKNKFNRVSPFSGGLAAVDAPAEAKESNGYKYYVDRGGYIDKSGNFVIGPMKMDWNYSFVCDIAPVKVFSKLEGDWVYIDKTGKYIYLNPDPDVIIKLSKDDSLIYIAKYSGNNENLPDYIPKIVKKIKQSLSLFASSNEKISVGFQIDEKGNIVNNKVLVYQSSGDKVYDDNFTTAIIKLSPFGAPSQNCSNWGKTIKIDFENKSGKLDQKLEHSFNLVQENPNY